MKNIVWKWDRYCARETLDIQERGEWREMQEWQVTTAKRDIQDIQAHLERLLVDIFKSQSWNLILKRRVTLANREYKALLEARDQEYVKVIG